MCSSDLNKVILAQNLNHLTLLSIINKINNWDGVSIEKQIARKYPQGSILANILGYISRSDQEGKAGLEKTYNTVLSPQEGILEIQRDSQGRQLNAKITQNPKPGKSLVLNIDLPLQQKIYETLEKRMAEVGSPEANAVAINPNNGHVLAIVNLPSYDNNIFSFPISQEKLQVLEKTGNFSLFNSAISGIGFPTGSVIKPLISLAALEEHIIDAQTKLPCPEKICVANRYTHQETCYHDWKYHGPSDLKRAIAESVNTYFYAVGGGTKSFQGLGAQKIEDWKNRL